jgi:diacylglycerol kinase (ATP)
VSRDIALLVNPTANKGRAARLVEPVAARLRELGCTVRVLTGADAGAAAELARDEVAAGTEVLAVLGGDGMCHLGLQQVAGTGTLLGIVPAGTGNDLARSCGIPMDPLAAAETIAKGQPRTIDLCRAAPANGDAPADAEPAGTWWGTVLCAGFDSRVNERANRMSWPRNRLRYDLATYAELAMLRPRQAVVTVDGTTWEGPVTQVDIGNGPAYGGGLRICPDADLTDGLLDVAIVAPLSRTRLTMLKPKLPSGELAEHPRVKRLRGARVRVVMDGAVAYADGERIGPLPLDVSVVPGALRVLSADD